MAVTDKAGRQSINIWIDAEDWERLGLIGRVADTGRASKSDMIRLAVKKYVQSIFDTHPEIKEFVDKNLGSQPLSLVKENQVQSS